MPLNLKNDAVERLARELARRTGRSLTDAVRDALEQRLELLDRQAGSPAAHAQVAAIQAFVREQPVRDARDGDAILYGRDGLPR